ncbi:MAG: hypothetical protein AAGU05_15605, partial [Anaerolineaceae bacterium]
MNLPASRIPQRFLPPQRVITQRLEGSGVDWVITGRLGWALRGIPLEIHDIDLQTDQPGAQRMDALLAGYSRQKLYWRESERIRSHFAVLEIEGITVEIMGAMQKLLPDGAWEPPVDVRTHREWVDFQGMRLPVLSLDYEHRAYQLMGRLEKARLLEPY